MIFDAIRNIRDRKAAEARVAEAIAVAEDRASAEAAKWAARTAGLDAEHLHLAEARRKFITGHCEPATAREYAAWLAGYLARGGQISYSYDYPMTQRGVTVISGSPFDGSTETAPSDLSWMVLRSRPDRVPSLYGAMSVHVIVPEDVPFTPADLRRTFHGAGGHSDFYFMRGFERVAGIVPLYTDVRDILMGGA